MRENTDHTSIFDEFADLAKGGCFTYDPAKSYGYTRKIFKTAALFYDKIYIDKFDYLTLRNIYQEDVCTNALFMNDRITGGIAHYMKMNERSSVIDERDAFTRGVLELARAQNISLIPLYGTIHQIESKLPIEVDSESLTPNDTNTIELLLTSFPLITERNLTWEQVEEFRADIAAIGGLRKMRSLLLEIAKCKTTVEAADTVCLLIECYKTACKKHGVETASSIFNQVYDKNTVIASIGTGVVAGSIEAAVLVGAIKLIADVTMTVHTAIRNKADIAETHQNGEVAMQLQRLSDEIQRVPVR